MKNVLYAFIVLLVFALPAFGQENLEFYGGYQHASGDQGLDGFNVGLGWNPTEQFQLFLNYDGLYDHSTLGSFALTGVGSTFVNSHMVGMLTGPRYFLHSARIKGHRIVPFVEAGFGEYRLRTELRSDITGEVASADTAFAWALGGGVDYKIYSHWSVRGDLGLLRTHIANSGQSRVRLGLNVVYSFRGAR
jgi:opacity protein-like surface antigen